MTVLFSIALAYVALLFLRAGLAMAYARTLPATPEESLPLSTMTIAQPILSGDPLLESRLETNLTSLSGQSFLWLIDEDDSAAKHVADVLRARHPLIELRVEICPPCPDATNPKLWKLNIAAALVRTPFFCVLDDDTTLRLSSAAALTAGARSHTIATGLPCYFDAGDLSSGLLAQFVNNSSVFTYLGTSRVLPPFTLNGMGYVLRREELARVKNFEPILHELTDDLALATLVLRHGGTIHQSPAPLHVQTGVEDFAHYLRLMHRWHVFALLLLRKQSIPVQLLIFALHGLPPILFVMLFVCVAAKANPASWLLIAFVLSVRAVIITAMHRRFFKLSLHRPLLSVLSELMQPAHLFHAIACRTIRWRTRHYRVRDTGDFAVVS